MWEFFNISGILESMKWYQHVILTWVVILNTLTCWDSSLLFVGGFPAVFNYIASHVILISQSIF